MKKRTVLIAIASFFIFCLYIAWQKNNLERIKINEVLYSNKTKELLGVDFESSEIEPIGYEQDNHGRVLCKYKIDIMGWGTDIYFVWIALQKVEYSNSKAYYINDMNKNELLNLVDEETKKELGEKMHFYYVCSNKNINDKNKKQEFEVFLELNHWGDPSDKSIEYCSFYNY